MTRPRAILAWSSGKDSAWVLHVLRRQQEVEVVGLLTTINEHFDRVAMHAVRSELLRAQALAVGLPLHPWRFPGHAATKTTRPAMSRAVTRLKQEGVSVMAFGDLFLEDVRKVSRRKLAGSGHHTVFPLWGIPTVHARSAKMIAGGFKHV